MKLTIEGTKDEVVALVRELGENKMSLTYTADGLVDMTWPPKPEPVSRTNPADTSTSSGPVDPAVIKMNSLAEGHRKSLGGTNTFKGACDGE